MSFWGQRNNFFRLWARQNIKKFLNISYIYIIYIFIALVNLDIQLKYK
jgi:hypothetical protein